jgi:hypothetical protein
MVRAAERGRDLVVTSAARWRAKPHCNAEGKPAKGGPALKRFIVPLFVVAALVAGLATSVGAKPPGDTRDSDVGKMLYSFNMIAVPHDWAQEDDVCDNSGRRIFYERNAGGSIGTLTWLLDVENHSFILTDCDGTDGDAVIEVDGAVEFWVVVRVLGAQTDNLGITCTDILNDTTTDLCQLDGVRINLNKSKDFTKIMDNIFDDDQENVLWTLDTRTNFRIAQVRIYEKV